MKKMDADKVYVALAIAAIAAGVLCGIAGLCLEGAIFAGCLLIHMGLVLATHWVETRSERFALASSGAWPPPADWRERVLRANATLMLVAGVAILLLWSVGVI